MKGILNIYSGDCQYKANIVGLINYDYAGKRDKSNNEYRKLIYDLGIAECYDLGYDDIVDSVDIEYINVDKDTEYSIEAEVVKSYYDYNQRCYVVEFKS